MIKTCDKRRGQRTAPLTSSLHGTTGEHHLLSAYTIFHAVLSLVGIGSGFVVLYGLLEAGQLGGWTKIFLTTTAATSVTGFLFCISWLHARHRPGYPVRSIVLAAAMLALYRFGLAGGWRRTYVITSVIALYFNFFVLFVQSFQKIPCAQSARAHPVGTALPDRSARGFGTLHRARNPRHDEVSSRTAAQGRQGLIPGP